MVLCRGQNKMGPLSFEQLRQLVAEEKLKPPDRVMRAGSSLWVVAGSVEGLMPREAAAHRAPQMAPSPASPAPWLAVSLPEADRQAIRYWLLIDNQPQGR